MQIKTTMWYQFTPNIEWLKLKGMTIPTVEQDANQVELSYIAGGNVRWYNQFGKVWQFL